MVITIINQHANNFGDEAACIAVLTKLLERKEISEINLMYIGKGIVHFNNKKVKHNKDVSIKNIGLFHIVSRIFLKKLGYDYRGNKVLKKYLSIIDSSDLIFVSPAGADLGRYKVWAALLNLYLVNSCDKKIVFHLNTIGTSGSWIFDHYANKILRKSRIYVRERKSQRYLNSINIDSTFGVDSAFLLPNASIKKVETKKIVFIPTQLSVWNKDYKYKDIEGFINDNIILPVIKFSQEHGLEIELLPHLGTVEEKQYYESIANEYGDAVKIGIAKDVKNVWDYQNHICNSLFVVSMRYHGIVIAAKNAIPFVSIAYENKMCEVSEYVNMKKQNIEIKCVTYEKLMDLMDCTLVNLPQIHNRLMCIDDIYKSAERPIRENVK